MPQANGVVGPHLDELEPRGKTSQAIGDKHIEDHPLFFHGQQNNRRLRKLPSDNRPQGGKHGDRQVLFTKLPCQETDNSGGEKKIPDPVWFENETTGHRGLTIRRMNLRSPAPRNADVATRPWQPPSCGSADSTLSGYEP